MIGRAIIRAAKLEKAQNWFGVLPDPSMLTPECNALLANMLIKPLVVDYDIPLKPNAGLKNPCKVINWRFNMNVEKGIASLFPPSINPDDMSKKKILWIFLSG